MKLQRADCKRQNIQMRDLCHPLNSCGAQLPGGRYLALGTTGYVQNPSGASISEAAQPLLVVLNSDGSLAQNLGYTGGARHNQLTTIAPLNGRWLLGGMINGPGTHSGAADRKLVVADGFLRQGSNLAAE